MKLALYVQSLLLGLAICFIAYAVSDDSRWLAILGGALVGVYVAISERNA
jgi:hypothetical protein